MDISAWLRRLELERYEQAFEENEIDAEILTKLTGQDLVDIGVAAVGHRRKLLEAIAELAEHASRTDHGFLDDAAPTARTGQAERRQVTILFCDLVDSTALSGRLDPEDMGQVIGAYQDCCAEVITSWDGHIAKYMGDGVLACFGWPIAHEDDAERAVRSALQLTEKVGKLRPKDGVDLRVRVGIATGLVVVGNLLGDSESQEEALVGATPNLAARLQTLAGPGSVVIDEKCRQLVSGLFDYADLGRCDLKGVAEPIQIWRVVGESSAESRFEALRGRQLTVLVGREHEVGLLVDRWERAKEGEGQVVLLSGEPGIGKSRIARALRARLSDQPHTPLSHYCSPYHTNSTLYPVIGLLQRAAGFVREDDADARVNKLETLLARGTEALTDTVPLVAALLDTDTGERYPPLALSPQRRKQRTLEVLIDQVEGLATEQPVLAVYEDVHWIDPTTLEVLGLLIERIQRLPVLILITFRPEFDPPWAGHAHVMQLSLSRLIRRHGEALVVEVAGGKALPTEVLDQILAKTDGVPLFVEELTKTVLESGLLKDDGRVFSMTGRLPDLAIPASLQDSLLARLDRVPSIKEVAQIGAVIGRDFEHKVLAAVSALSNEQLDNALDQLVATGLIFRRGVFPDAAYSFKHALVRDAAYQSLLKSKRRSLHERVAASLIDLKPGIGNTEPEVVAYHYTEARLTSDAIKAWRNAAQRSVGRGSHAEAIANARQGLALVDTLSESAERDRDELGLLSLLGASLIATRGYSVPEVSTTYGRAKVLCERLGDDRQLSGILSGLAVFTLVSGDAKLARSLAQQSYRLAKKLRATNAIVTSQHNLGLTFYYLGEFTQAHEHLEQSIALAGNARRHLTHYADPRANGLSFWSLVLWSRGYPDQAIRRNEEAFLVAERSEDPFTIVNTCGIATNLGMWIRDARSTQVRAEKAVALCKAHGFGHWLATLLTKLGWALVQQRDFEQGMAQIHDGLERMRMLAASSSLNVGLFALADACISAGKPNDAQSALGELLALIEETDERRAEAEVHRLRGEALLSLPEVDQAQAAACFERAIAVAKAQDAKSWELRAATSLAHLWREQGKRKEAHDILAPVYDWFTEGFGTPDLKDAKALLDGIE